MHSKHNLLLVLLGLTLAACSGTAPAITTPTQATDPTATLTVVPSPTETTAPPTATATPTKTPTPTATPPYPPEGFGPTDFPDNVNPLTGLYVADTTLLDRRPVAVKINIVPRTSTRPPWGLGRADVVYDFYHNDGYTRFHAIFYGNDADLAGPIRSARLPDDPLVRMYGSIFTYGGADPKIDARFLNADYASRLVVEGGRRSVCPPTPTAPLCRYDPNGFDLLLADTRLVHAFIDAQGIDDRRPDLEGNFFLLDPPAGGRPAEQVTTRYSGDSYNRWEYDPSSGSYLRLQDDVFDQGQGEEYAPLIDQLDNAQVSAANVVVLLAPHEYFQPPPADIIEILFNGSGTAYAFRDGQAYQVNWARPADGGLLTLSMLDGDPYPFKPGNTWFQIVGQTSEITEPEPTAWRFQFHIP
jgi:hypothetical protein